MRGSAVAVHAFNANQNQSGIDLFKLRPIQAPFLQNAEPEVLDEHIRFFHQLTHKLPPFGSLHIDGERFLAALKFHEIGFLVPEFRVFTAVAIAAQPSLAADDLGAELAEDSRHGRTRRAGGELNHANPL